MSSKSKTMKTIWRKFFTLSLEYNIQVHCQIVPLLCEREQESNSYLHWCISLYGSHQFPVKINSRQYLPKMRLLDFYVLEIQNYENDLEKVFYYLSIFSSGRIE